MTSSARGQSLFFFLALRALSRALASLADVFEKNEKKNKTTSVYRLRFSTRGMFGKKQNTSLNSETNLKTNLQPLAGVDS